jgi:signal transduction histidine kinase
MNSAAMPLLGMREADAAPAGRGLLRPVDQGPWRMRVQEFLTAHSASGRWEEPEGAASYRTAVSMFRGAESGDFGVLLILRDQTAERRLDAVKEEFFQAAAHDLRAPLFALQGYLRLLRRSMEPDARQAAWFDAIDQSCERLTGLVKDALDSARIESGRLVPAEGRVDPRALLRRAARLFQPLSDEKAIAVEIRVAPSAPEAFEGDERLLERLIHNLLANALKFTPRGGFVTLEAAAAGPDRVELVVSDTGPGIPEDLRAAVFEKFRQLDQGGQPKTGFGLGLSICAKIVKLHGGEIWVQPGKAGGSQFVVRLPLNRRKEAASE